MRRLQDDDEEVLPDLVERQAEGELGAADMVCPACGYSLRGLQGDPVCCPECGREYKRMDLLAPSASLQREAERRLRRLETYPALCIAGMWGLMVAASVLGWWLGLVFWAKVVALPSILLWVLGIYGFGRRSDFVPGWHVALAWYHLGGFAVVLPFCLSAPVLVILTSKWAHWDLIDAVWVALSAVWLVSFRYLNSRFGFSLVMGFYEIAQRRLRALPRRPVEIDGTGE